MFLNFPLILYSIWKLHFAVDQWRDYLYAATNVLPRPCCTQRPARELRAHVARGRRAVMRPRGGRQANCVTWGCVQHAIPLSVTDANPIGNWTSVKWTEPSNKTIDFKLLFWSFLHVQRWTKARIPAWAQHIFQNNQQRQRANECPSIGSEKYLQRDEIKQRTSINYPCLLPFWCNDGSFTRKARQRGR